MAVNDFSCIEGVKKNPTKRAIFSAKNPWLIVVLLLACTVGSIVECQDQLTVESRQQKDLLSIDNDLAATMRYLERLEKLDQYWSEVGRPRFGRSEYKQPALSYGSVANAPSERRQIVKFLRGPRSGNGRASNALLELLGAKLAHKYNSNEVC